MWEGSPPYSCSYAPSSQKSLPADLLHASFCLGAGSPGGGKGQQVVGLAHSLAGFAKDHLFKVGHKALI